MAGENCPFPAIHRCESGGRENQSVADMDGTLLIGRSSFPYFALAAFEAGGVLRLIFLLLATPLAGFLYYFISESAGIRVLIFATFSGMKVSVIESVARAVLPKFYSTDLHPETWRVFSACGKICVLTANPRIMVEPFLREYLGVDVVLGTEISTYKGRATGFVNVPGVLVGKNKAVALQKAFRDESTGPDIGIGDRRTDFPFMHLCKEKSRKYRQLSLQGAVNPKLAAKFCGPYLVEKRIGEVAYQLKLPAGCKIHPVFHISVLKLHHGPPPVHCVDVPVELQSQVPVLQPERILQRRLIQRNDASQVQWLIQWTGLPLEDASWEYASIISSQFPNFQA